MDKNLQILQTGNLRIISRHPILNQFANDISAHISDPVVLANRVNVYVGTHKIRRRHLQNEGLNLGIQTEHFCDEDGLDMWRKQSKLRILLTTHSYDRVLDLSEANETAYSWLPKYLRKKVDFGPYIFPKEKIPYCEGKEDSAVFYGAVNERRREIINSIPHHLYHCVEPGTFGNALSEIVKSHKAILNIHFSDGVYTEYPRLLSAYLAGKSVVSEKLSGLLQSDRHYTLLESFDGKNSFKEIYENFGVEIARKYSFEDYLCQLDTR